MSNLLTTLRTSVKGVLPDGTTTRKLPTGIGRGLNLGVDFHEGHIGLYLGLYEIELNSSLRRLCPSGTKSFDIGGHMGYDALVLAKLSHSRVVCVEYSTDWCEIIRENVEANPTLVPLITVLQGYVADDRSSEQNAVSIDAMAEKYFVPDFIKIDIEGGEASALRGAYGVLTTRKPNLLIEVHSKPLEVECLGILARDGYQPEIVDQRRWLPDHRPIAHNRWIVATGRRST